MRVLATMVLLCMSNGAFAQACWVEWDLRGQSVNRGGQCTEKITVPDPERGFCKPRVESDQVRKAASCPPSAKVRDGGQAVTATVAARCLGIRPPNAGGKADVVYYGGKDFSESKESLQSLCTAFEGKWVESGK
jgi:hypothetical protein